MLLFRLTTMEWKNLATLSLNMMPRHLWLEMTLPTLSSSIWCLQLQLVPVGSFLGKLHYLFLILFIYGWRGHSWVSGIILKWLP